MVYRKYGAAFHQLRIQHNLSLSAFEDLGIAKSTLSNFENGKSMISFDKLDAALAKMNTSPFDYSILINNGEPDYFVSLFSRIETAYFQNNIKQLQEIEQETRELDEHSQLISYSAKCLYTSLENSEIKTIEDYLKGVQVWGWFELSLLTNTIEQLTFSLVLKLMEDLFQSRKFFQQVRDWRSLVAQMNFKMIMILIDHQDEPQASKWIERAKTLFKPTDILSRALINFGESYYLYRFENQEQGKRKMRQVLKALSILEAKEIRANLLRQYNKRIPH